MIEGVALLIALIGILADDNENKANALFVLTLFAICAVYALKGI